MKIIIDAMGGDNAPLEIVKGALLGMEHWGVEVLLTGDTEAILRALRDCGHDTIPHGMEIVHTTETVDMCDDPSKVFRHKKDTSMGVGLTLLRDGKADALVSAGSTGALLAGATLITKRIRGIRRAALAPVVPNARGNMVLIDCGATAEGTPEYLLQFAFMGAYYARRFLGIENPRVGLLNIGTEPSKGMELQKAAHALLTQAHEAGRIRFVGNIEGREAISQGAADVLVTDGFTGNVCLKTIEGTAKTLMRNLKAALMSTALSKVGALLVKGPLGALKEKMSPDTYGGTPLLGVKGAVIVGHGSSNETAVKNGIAVAAATVRAHVPEVIAERVAAAPASASAAVGAEEEGEAAASDAR